MCRRVDIEEERATLVFSNLDADKVGYISTDIIKKSLGEDITDPVLEAMIIAADRDGDGMVTER
jgi:Ca2+-binding EF-hand superfamily protein